MKKIVITALALTCSMAFAQNARVYETNRYSEYYHDEQRTEKNMAVNRLEHEIINERRLLDYDLRDREIDLHTFRFFAQEYDSLLSRVRFLKSRPNFSWHELTRIQQKFNSLFQQYERL